MEPVKWLISGNCFVEIEEGDIWLRQGTDAVLFEATGSSAVQAALALLAAAKASNYYELPSLAEIEDILA